MKFFLLLKKYLWLIFFPQAVHCFFVSHGQTTNFCTSSSLSLSKSASYSSIKLYGEEDGNHHAMTNVPAGEEALYSAKMARTIRRFRTSRRLIAQEEGEQEQSSHSHLLLAPLTTTKKDNFAERWLTYPAKTNKKNQGWSTRNMYKNKSNDQEGNKKSNTTIIAPIRRVPTRTHGTDLPYQSTIKALKVYHSIHGDLVMPRRYAVPEDEGKCGLSVRILWGVQC